MASHPGRNVSAEFRRNRKILLAIDDTCHLCGHPGSRTADHIIAFSRWPPGVPGVDGLGNLAPAHGSMGPARPPNRCTTCGQLCNQARKDRPIGAVRSRVLPAPPAAARPQSRRW